MVKVSVLNDGLKNMYNAEKRGKRQAMIRPSSKVIVKFLSVMQKHGYIDEFESVDDHRAGKIVVELNGRLNKCGVISPRFDISVKDIESWTARLLPSRQCFQIIRSVMHASLKMLNFGYIVLTTSAGIMDHEEARRKNVGGKVLGFFY
ncbi:40S ribosomal protein S15A [Rhynchospora pubera]|uniref:Small ribosomal subunit protein uS8c n=1 Tax=Rhynchospora pubera TaxID=906938 RepID=A0AAV8H036_9POAL|nr:40S ribosomal protein S15A [Rhynchospora pubera]